MATIRISTNSIFPILLILLASSVSPIGRFPLVFHLTCSGFRHSLATDSPDAITSIKASSMSLDEMAAALDSVNVDDWTKPVMMDEDKPSLPELDIMSVFSGKSDRAYSPGAVLTPPVSVCCILSRSVCSFQSLSMSIYYVSSACARLRMFDSLDGFVFSLSIRVAQTSHICYFISYRFVVSIIKLKHTLNSMC